MQLAIGFFRQIHAELKPELTRKEIGVVLHRWTTRRGYYQAVARGDARRNLDGSEAGVLDEASRGFARNALAALPRQGAHLALHRDSAPAPAPSETEKEKTPAPEETRHAAS